MSSVPGVAIAYHKDGSMYYRASITYKNKHISLGSFATAAEGHLVYKHASAILNASSISIDEYEQYSSLPFAKFVSLINFKNNGIYFKTPIYLLSGYFLYYLTPDISLKFDRDDLFFYSSHTIQQKGGYLFVCHYGSQYGILSRYGIHKFAVEGRDYIFVNGDNQDYRYQNIKIINQYMGVSEDSTSNKQLFIASIHINGNYIVGRYPTEIDAAIAYNKAADILNMKGLDKKYIKNYIATLSKEEYQKKYIEITISDKIINYEKII